MKKRLLFLIRNQNNLMKIAKIKILFKSQKNNKKIKERYIQFRKTRKKLIKMRNIIIKLSYLNRINKLKNQKDNNNIKNKLRGEKKEMRKIKN